MTEIARPRIAISVAVKGARRKTQVFAGIDAINRELELEMNPSMMKRIRVRVRSGETVEEEVGNKVYVFAPVAE
ncbi:MAG TPA: hypothetical protein VJU59_09170 [Paraburkholderia sp.]|uniref:hypothetical protein n=1 Tax=Paraburkholderia sp. TaxID=1926495 RepID=UPI002B46758F|nr:hypothetical protein [Paraburkholderia sp.]HKR39835.1 hypothetical protein [Paraburkholderia sp.]